jgi:hypothetical protein
VQQELTSLLQTAGLTLRKWASNNSTFLRTIPRELQETQQTFSLENEDGVTTLGLLWNPQDQLQVKSNITHKQQTDSTASTKRKVRATTASIFDPLGLLSPAVIAYKPKKTSPKDSPNFTGSSESLHTAEDLSTAAESPRPTGKRPLCSHKTLIRRRPAV